jgi:hypothetical protein
MNTVGKPERLGDSIRCVVSVAMLTEGWDCLDATTEILTASGWRGIGKINVDDSVYSLNSETGKLEIVPVLEYGERPLRPGERLVRIKSQHLDIRVTEGHGFHVRYRDPHRGGRLSQQMITRTGAELLERRSSYALPLSAEWVDALPGLPLTDDEIRLIAWCMTDGGFSNHKLVISQSKPYHLEIAKLLHRLGLDSVESIVEPGRGSYPNSRPSHRFLIPKGIHTGTLARNGWHPHRDYLDKCVSPLLHQMTRAQFLVFWEEMLKGDGEQVGSKSGWLGCCEKAQVDAYTHMGSPCKPVQFNKFNGLKRLIAFLHARIIKGLRGSTSRNLADLHQFVGTTLLETTDRL